jgi:hypothetical protein
MDPGSPTGHVPWEKTMSDTVLINDTARLKRGRFLGRARGAGESRRLRLKRLGHAVVDYVAEVMAEMERARNIHPVISAYRRSRP